jgi:hypothetical protein
MKTLKRNAMPIGRWTALALCLVCVHVRAEVQLTPAQRDSLGVKTIELVKVDVAKTYSATAQVLDATPLVNLLTDVRAAQAALAASSREADRSKELHAADATVSLKASEAARSQAMADESRLTTLRAQLNANWGRSVAAMSEGERDKLIADLLAGRRTLIKAELQQSHRGDLKSLRARVHSFDSSESWNGDLLGVLPLGQSQGIGRSYLLGVKDASLQAGQILAAELEDAKQRTAGIIVPRSAVIRWNASTWVFIEEEANKFVRQLIHPVEWTESGCLVHEDLQVGQHVVIEGAGLLLGTESSHTAQE